MRRSPNTFSTQLSINKINDHVHIDADRIKTLICPPPTSCVVQFLSAVTFAVYFAHNFISEACLLYDHVAMPLSALMQIKIYIADLFLVILTANAGDVDG